MYIHYSILIIDDEPLLLRGFVRVLQSAGYGVTGATTGAEGFRLARENRPDLILLDVALPDVDGIELCKQIKTEPALANTYVMMLSGIKTVSDDQVKGLEAGADDYLLKPIPNQELLARVQAILRIKEAETRLSNTLQELRQKNEELLKTQKQLQASQKKYEDLYDFAPVGYCTVDEDGLIAEANLTAAEQFGVEKSNLLHTPFHCYLADEDQEIFLSHLSKAFETMTRQTCEVRLRQQNCARCYVHLDSLVVRLSEETPCQCRTTITDITEREQAEEQIRQLSTAVEQSPNTVVITSIEGNIEYVNPQFTEITGYDSEEALGKNPNILKSGIHPPEFYEELWETICSGRIWRSEFLNKKKDGELYWESASISPIKNIEGRIINYVKVAQDITDHKRAEEAVLLLKNAIETAEIGITITDVERKIIYLNRTEAKMHGYLVDELIGKDGRIFSPEQYWQDIEFEQLESNWKREGVNIRKDGTIFPVYSVSTPVRNEAGGPIGIITVSEDITDRKRAEKELKNAKEAAETANRAKSEFLANMSHELRTPLNGILGYAQILTRDPELTESQRKGIEIIQRSGDHLLMILNDILDLSKIEAGKFDLEPVAFHLSKSLKSLVEMTRFRAEQKSISFFYEENPGLPYTVQGDEKRLRQVLLNLLGNAVKFTKQGKVSLRVYELNELNELEKLGTHKTHRTHLTDLTHKIRFEVEDTGIGISPEQIERIFSPFEQIKDTRLYTEGTGLGLAISQRLVRMMGSELHVKSETGQGSIFWFDVDLPEVEDVMAVATKPLRRIIGFRSPSVGSEPVTCKILIADDKDANRVMLKDMLLPTGFEVFEATNGCDAIAKAMQFHPDIILMDLVMPELDGFEATRQIRQISDLKDVIVIAISASVFEHTKEESFTAGCNDFLAKPVTEQALLDMLKPYLNIEWIYEDDIDDHHFQSSDQFSKKTIIPPPKEELLRLNKLATMGDIMAIRKYIEELKQRKPAYALFTARIHNFAKELRILDIQRFLKQYLDP